MANTRKIVIEDAHIGDTIISHVDFRLDYEFFMILSMTKQHSLYEEGKFIYHMTLLRSNCSIYTTYYEDTHVIEVINI